MKTKNILIIGPGRLGGQIAYYCLRFKQVEKVFLSGRNFHKTQGIVNDLREAFPHKKIFPIDNYNISEVMDLTFFAFSTLIWKEGIGVNERLIEAEENFRIVNEISNVIAPNFLKDIIVISNPVDILTWHVTKTFKSNRVFGFGISLDERRIAKALTNLLQGTFDRVPCVGEHGVSIVPLLSHVIPDSKISIELYSKVKELSFIHTLNIIRQSSIPFYGPLYEIERVIDLIILEKDGVVSMSRYLDDPFFGEIALSIGIPLKIQNGKVVGTQNIKMTEYETQLFHESVSVVKNQMLSKL